MGAIATFLARFGTALQFIIPLLRVLWKILNPRIKILLDKLWDCTEEYVETELDQLEKNSTCLSKSKLKEEIFNQEANRNLKKQGDSLTPAELNIARELVHYKKTKGKSKKTKGKSKNGKI